MILNMGQDTYGFLHHLFQEVFGLISLLILILKLEVKFMALLVFGTGAVPPGLIAESYWNLGYLGILFVPFLLGIFTRHIHTYFRYIDSNNNNKVLFYVVCFMNIPYSCFGSSITSALIGVIYLLVPLYLSLKYITKSENKFSV